MVKSSKLTKYQPVIIAAISLCVFVFIILKYTALSNDKIEKDIKEKLLETLIIKKSQIEKALSSRVYYTKGIAAYCSINPEITDDIFDKLAHELIRNDTVIGTMSISKDCIISAIYPYKQHESAIGLNLLKHPARRRIVENTIRTRNTFIAGPVDLVEGGTAFISYTPIFTKSENDSTRFWGVTDIVILKDKLFNELKLLPHDSIYRYALRGADGSGDKGKCFWGDPEVFNNDPITVSVYLPTGSWTLAGIPVNGWDSYLNKTEIITIFLYVCALIISILIWLLSKAVIRIREHEHELNAIFRSMQDLVIEYGPNGEYLKIASTNEGLLFKPSDELLGKTVYDVFNKDTADLIKGAIEKCLDSKQLVSIDYSLEIKGVVTWFHARISYMSDESVVFVAHDNTAKIKADEYLRKSEQNLKELNTTKDKFFSILAHDLRAPFSGFMGITEELKQNIDKLEKDEISELAGVMHVSAKNTFELLTNLLEWSGLQTGRVNCNPEKLLLSVEADSLSSLFASAAALKTISIENKIEKDIFAFADKNVFSTVMRNLVSNALKFTPHNGRIVISSERKGSSVEISVEDTGIGMTEELIVKALKIDSVFTRRGTDGEKGTGLGLVLCKDLIQKNGGEINIVSIPENGTKITFSLPAYTPDAELKSNEIRN